MTSLPPRGSSVKTLNFYQAFFAGFPPGTLQLGQGGVVMLEGEGEHMALSSLEDERLRFPFCFGMV